MGVKLFVRATLRAIPLVLLFFLGHLFPIPKDTVGENIHLGLLIFGLTALAAVIWAVVDALADSLRHTVLTWCGTAAMVALAQPLLGWADAGGDYDLGTAWTDLTSLSVFMFGLVALPAALAATAVHRWLISAAVEEEPVSQVDLKYPQPDEVVVVAPPVVTHQPTGRRLAPVRALSETP